MKVSYPVVFSKTAEGGYMAYVPDLQINTQGETLDETIAMVRDAIGLVGIDMEDDGKDLPIPSEQVEHNPSDTVFGVDVDLGVYRTAHRST